MALFAPPSVSRGCAESIFAPRARSRVPTTSCTSSKTCTEPRVRSKKDSDEICRSYFLDAAAIRAGPRCTTRIVQTVHSLSVYMCSDSIIRLRAAAVLAADIFVARCSCVYNASAQMNSAALVSMRSGAKECANDKKIRSIVVLIRTHHCRRSLPVRRPQTAVARHGHWL